MPLRIGVTLGDVGGVGPEVTVKALHALLPEDDSIYTVIGDGSVFERAKQLVFPGGERFSTISKQFQDRVRVLQPDGEGTVSSQANPGGALEARAAVKCLEIAARQCLDNQLDAMVTAPVNKESIIRSGVEFVGQTEYLSKIAGVDQTIMMLLGHDDRGRWLRVALVTTHVPLRDVADRITPSQLELAVTRAQEAGQALGLAQVRIGVCGLNPHAGEGGKIGDEEVEIIEPVLKRLRERGVPVSGPLSADTLFYHAIRGEYDVVVAMYHDQGLAPLKMMAFDTGVNWTLGLPFIRTSPDHGTAYDIAWKGVASHSSMVAAIQLAKKLAGG